jgi:NADPH:quinone reductase-like Zn-dependent oxidoreductase
MVLAWMLLWCTTIGTPPRCGDFPDPTALDHEVVVHVHAASLKPVDEQLAAGSHYASPRDVPFVCALTVLDISLAGNAYSLVAAGRRLAPWPSGWLCRRHLSFLSPVA